MLPFDFDPSDGVTSSQYDFEGIAAHEIGHALDLFRFSAQSTGTAGGVIDVTERTGAKYFSIDCSVTIAAAV